MAVLQDKIIICGIAIAFLGTITAARPLLQKLDKGALKTIYTMVFGYVILSAVDLAQKLASGKEITQKLLRQLCIYAMLIFVPFFSFAITDGHEFVEDFICKEVRPIEKKFLSVSIIEIGLTIVYPMVFRRNFKCPEKEADVVVLSEKIDNATEILKTQIAETCKRDGKELDFRKLEIQMHSICMMEVEKNTAQNFVKVLDHFDIQNRYLQCDAERHDAIQQLNTTQNAIRILNETFEDARQRNIMKCDGSAAESQVLLFDGSIDQGYLRPYYVRYQPSNGHKNSCTHKEKFDIYNVWLRKISDASKTNRASLLTMKNNFEQFVKDLMVFDTSHHNHEVFIHLKHRIISDVALMNACNLWYSRQFIIELEDEKFGFKNVICKHI